MMVEADSLVKGKIDNSISQSNCVAASKNNKTLKVKEESNVREGKENELMSIVSALLSLKTMGKVHKDELEQKSKAKKRKKTVLVSSISSKNDESCPGSNTGHVSIKRSPHCQWRYDERSNLQSSVGEEGANKDVKEQSLPQSKNRISGEVATIQVLAKNSKNADPYTWRRSGNMRIMGLPYHRHYYKCSEIGCFAKKHIDRDANDPSMCIITYKGQHNHAIP
ncbi:putative WRKY transcription factor 17 [Carex littledalei]|uniref:Putative WRKY transcription factor 17 n=1 Tax=Carex littledalei TaxID=544730 RepID=A0A833VXL1_9POAL|nr:putative WRKY transcription factor 17 [Carex littledalei]